MTEFTCAMCKETFEAIRNDEWNDFKAAEELLTLFPEAKNDSTDSVCEPCFHIFMKWFSELTEEEKREMRETS